jgi:polyisoprenoid-binding protein YceI
MVILYFIFSLSASPQNYKPLDDGSKVHFSIKNFGINTGGALSGLKGNIVFIPDNLAESNFNVSVDVKTIDTDIENRDEHLKGENYFDTEKYPLIVIKSKKINNDQKFGSYNFIGTLTMHGVTKEISFPFKAIQQANDYLFTGDFEINRLDYSVGQPSAILSKTVKVSLSVLAKKS